MRSSSLLGRLLTIIFFLFVVIWAVYLVWFYGWSSLTPSYHGIGVTDFGVEIDGVATVWGEWDKLGNSTLHFRELPIETTISYRVKCQIDPTYDESLKGIVITAWRLKPGFIARILRKRGRLVDSNLFRATPAELRFYQKSYRSFQPTVLDEGVYLVEIAVDGKTLRSMTFEIKKY